MDREKQKKLERERMESERAKMAKDDGKELEEEEGDGPRVPRKSKFVSNLFLALTAKCIPFKKKRLQLCVVLVIKGHLRSCSAFCGTCSRTEAMIY